MRKFLPYFIIFTVTAALFFWLQSSPTLGDGDSFYHAKMADLMIQQRGVIKDFPWLPFTILKEHYTDHHLLFHIFIIPFILIFKNPLVAIKMATVLLAAVFFLVFYWLLRKWQIKYAFIYALLPLTSYVLPLRFALAKAPAISLIALTLGLATLLKRKKLLLFLLSFIYVWLHGGWPIILIATICYCLAETIKNIIDNPPRLPTKIKNTNINNIEYFFYLYFLYFIFYFSSLIRRFFVKSNTKLLLACLAGITAGVIINPYFPQNLYFYWVQIFKVAVINYHSKIGVGGEWYPYDPFDLVRDNFLICLLWLFALAWFLVSFKKPQKTFPELELLTPILGRTREELFLFFLSTLLLIYTIKSRRMAEYFIPVAVFFIALTFNRGLTSVDWHGYWQNLKKIILNLRFLIPNILLIFLFVAGCGALIGSTIQLWQKTRQYYIEARPFSNFQKASQFLKENTPSGTTIFHNDWSSFPILFYHNDHNYYISGLDSTFFYDKNPQLYNLWWDIASGKDKESLSEKIKNNFNTSYVLAEKPRAPIKDGKKSFKAKFIEIVESDNNFQKIYEDDETKIYKIK